MAQVIIRLQLSGHPLGECLVRRLQLPFIDFGDVPGVRGKLQCHVIGILYIQRLAVAVIDEASLVSGHGHGPITRRSVDELTYVDSWGRRP
jgi:hypothetical protein